MHANPHHPNILQDMLTTARNGASLYNRNAYGLPSAKHRLIPPRSYPYSSIRQDTRALRKAERKREALST